MRTLRYMTLFMLAFCLVGQTAWGAETNYVTDVTQITLRTGPSIQNKIVLMLRSGQPVEILKTQDEWSYVRLPDRDEQTEGWVLTQYLISRLPWEDKAKRLMTENEQLKDKLASIQKQLTETSTQGREAAKNLKETTLAFSKLEKDYDALKTGSADYLKLRTAYDTMAKTLRDSQQKVSDLTRENDILQVSQGHKWFGMGASVLLIGLLVGLVLGRRQRRSKSGLLY